MTKMLEEKSPKLKCKMFKHESIIKNNFVLMLTL